MKVSFPITLTRTDVIKGEIEEEVIFECKASAIQGYYIRPDNKLLILVASDYYSTTYDPALVDELEEILSSVEVTSKLFYTLLQKVERLVSHIEYDSTSSDSTK